MMVSRRYCLSEILALGAIVANVQGCASVAFQQNYSGPPPITTSTRARRKSIPPQGVFNAADNSIRSSGQHQLSASIGGKHEHFVASNSSKRRKLRNLLGLGQRSSTTSTTKKHSQKFVPKEEKDGTKSNEDAEVGPFKVATVDELNDYFNEEGNKRFRKKSGKIDFDARLESLYVEGDTQIIGSIEHKDLTHPVVQLLHERRRQIESIKQEGGSQSTQSAQSNKRNVQRTMPPEDGYRVALAVEGGGMRGCVTAGMVTAIHYLGLEDAVDVVYGSSAGTVIGAYFITRQLPWFGPELYYDALTTAGKDFINTKRFLRAVGFGLLDPRLTKDVCS